MDERKLVEAIEDLQFAIAAETRVHDGKPTRLTRSWEKELDALTTLVFFVSEGQRFEAQCVYDELDKHSRARLDAAGMKRWLAAKS